MPEIQPVIGHRMPVNPMNAPVCTHLSIRPRIPASAFVAPGAVVVGDVSVGEDSSIWYGCVLRADIESIRIGSGTNLQDGTIVHLSSERGTLLGDRVTCGHRCLLHACTVGDEVLIGMGAILMDGVEVGANCIIGAGSLLTKGQVVPPGSLVVGSPAKIVRPLEPAERAGIRHWSDKYIQVAREHTRHLGAPP